MCIYVCVCSVDFRATNMLSCASTSGGAVLLQDGAMLTAIAGSTTSSLQCNFKGPSINAGEMLTFASTRTSVSNVKISGALTVDFAWTHVSLLVSGHLFLGSNTTIFNTNITGVGGLTVAGTTALIGNNSISIPLGMCLRLRSPGFLIHFV